MLTLDGYECVCGTGTSGEFKQLPWSPSSWLGQAVGWCTMMQWSLIFQKGPKSGQNHLCARRWEEEELGHTIESRSQGCFQVQNHGQDGRKESPPPHQNLLRRGPVTTFLLTHPLPCPSAQGMCHGRQTNVLMSVAPGLS